MLGGCEINIRVGMRSVNYGVWVADILELFILGLEFLTATKCESNSSLGITKGPPNYFMGGPHCPTEFSHVAHHGEATDPSDMPPAPAPTFPARNPSGVPRPPSCPAHGCSTALGDGHRRWGYAPNCSPTVRPATLTGYHSPAKAALSESVEACPRHW